MHSACAALFCDPLPAWLCHIFPHCLLKCTIFERGGGEVTEYKKVCFGFLYNFFLKKKSASETSSERYCNKCTLVFMWRGRHFCQIFMKIEFLQQSCKKSQISNLIIICQFGSELLDAGGQTEMTKLIGDFRNFRNVHKKLKFDDLWRMSLLEGKEGGCMCI